MEAPPNGWERWRGSVDALMNTLQEDLDALQEWRHAHEQAVATREAEVYKALHELAEGINKRITSLEIRVAVSAAVGGGAVAGAASLLQWMIKDG